MIMSKYGVGMSVGELREAMKDIPDETPVVGYWETIHVPLQSALPFATTGGRLVLELDVDQ